MSMSSSLKGYFSVATLVSRQYEKFKSHFLIVTIVFFSAAALAAYVPVLLKKVIDGSASSVGHETVMFLATSYAICWTAAGVLQNIKGIFSAKVLARIDAAFSIELLSNVLRYDHKKQKQLEAGKVASEIGHAATSLSAITSSLFWVLCPAGFEIIVGGLFLGFYISTPFAIVYALIAIALVGMAYLISLRTQSVHALIFDASNSSNNYVIERLSALYDIKINNAVDRQIKIGNEVFQAEVQKIWVANLRMGLYLTAQTCCIGLALGVLTILPMTIFNGKGEAGNFVLIAGYVGALAGQLRMLCAALIDLQRSGVALKRGLDIIKFKNGSSVDEVEQFAKQIPLFKIRSQVGTEASIEILSGQMSGFKGRSGIGKTTLLNALLGLERCKGCAIATSDVLQRSASGIGGVVALAPQFPVLLNASLRTNLLFGTNVFVPDAELIDLLQIFWPETQGNSPLLLDDLIGRTGRVLSGGEIQRVGLMRAILRKTPILLLDEPTSALDGATSRRVMQFIKEKVSTVVVVSHDDSVLELCDRVHSLDQMDCFSTEVRLQNLSRPGL